MRRTRSFRGTSLVAVGLLGVGSACNEGPVELPARAAPRPVDLARTAKALHTVETVTTEFHPCCTRTEKKHTDARHTNDLSCNTGLEFVGESCDGGCCAARLLIGDICPSVLSCSGGPCPIIPIKTDAECADRDKDGLLDDWETGVVDGVPLAAIGAKPDHKDLFVELDWMPGAQPTQASVQEWKRAFCAAPIWAGGNANPDLQQGIKLWVDTGTLTDPQGRESPIGPCTCGDGLDNDDDQRPDAEDPDCRTYDPRGSENGAAAGTCEDGKDNHPTGDALTDSLDPSCRVWDPSRTESNIAYSTCLNGVDEDQDGLFDTADPDCQVGDNLGNTLQPPFSNLSGLNTAFYPIRATSFTAGRSRVFRYALVAAPTNNNFGTSSGGNTATTLNDTTKTWVTNEWRGRVVSITGGTGNGQSARIFSNTATTLVIGGEEDGAGAGTCGDGSDNGLDGTTDTGDSDCTGWATVPDATSTFRISTIGGQAELGGNDLMVIGDVGRLFEDASNLMHELGHNLTLGHGGNQPNNCKPNYVSIMNYDHSNGILQAHRSLGQDLDGNSAADGLIIDFSPPRIPTNIGLVRTVTPLFDLLEANLDELLILDPDDRVNRFVFTDRLGNKVQWALHGDRNNDGTSDGIDWTGDGAFTGGAGFIVNIDTAGSAGVPADCANGRISTVPMTGHNDWEVISIPFGHFGDSSTGPLSGFHPDPSFEEKQTLLTALNTTDLAVQQTAPTVEIGQDLTFSIVAENQRPNPAASIEVTATLPPSAAYVSDTGGCSRASNVLTCESDQLHPGSSRTLSVTVKTAGTCVGGKPAPLTATAAVRNTARLAGADPDPSDNTRTLTIIPTDTGGPRIQNLHVDRTTLWPPNHKMVPVKVSAIATDACDGAVTCALSSITSNEGVLAPGTGNTSPDWLITGPNSAQLRAERAGGGSGRVYTLTHTCKDASNNTTSAQVTVRVPPN